MAASGENVHKLQALSGKHKDVAALLVQGLGRTEIAGVVEFTPEYVTWLCRDPLFKEYMEGISTFHDTRLDAMYGRVVDSIDDALKVGTVDEKLRAGRLQLEVTKRLGSYTRSEAQESSIERLTTLAERLVQLNIGKGNTYESQAHLIQQG